MIERLLTEYSAAANRLLFLDYDGVLAPIVARPELAVPTDEILGALRSIAAHANTKIVVVSGRDHDTLEEWLGSLPIDMSAEHGHFDKREGSWRAVSETDMSWRDDVMSAMKWLVDQYPGSHIEIKHASLVWHYRQVESEVDESLAMQAVCEAADSRAIAMSGKCVIDVRAPGANKGEAVRRWFDPETYDFVMAIGDDVTDEAMFAALPASAWTIKVGAPPTAARHRFEHQSEVVDLLKRLAALDLSAGVKHND